MAKRRLFLHLCARGSRAQSHQIVWVHRIPRLHITARIYASHCHMRMRNSDVSDRFTEERTKLLLGACRLRSSTHTKAIGASLMKEYEPCYACLPFRVGSGPQTPPSPFPQHGQPGSISRRYEVRCTEQPHGYTLNLRRVRMTPNEDALP